MVEDYCRKTWLGKEILHNYAGAIIFSEPLNPTSQNCWKYHEVAVCQECGNLRPYIAIQPHPSQINKPLQEKHLSKLLEMVQDFEQNPPTPPKKPKKAA